MHITFETLMSFFPTQELQKNRERDYKKIPPFLNLSLEKTLISAILHRNENTYIVPPSYPLQRHLHLHRLCFMATENNIFFLVPLTIPLLRTFFFHHLPGPYPLDKLKQ